VKIGKEAFYASSKCRSATPTTMLQKVMTENMLHAEADEALSLRRKTRPKWPE